mgnify:CR=1 FL=1
MNTENRPLQTIQYHCYSALLFRTYSVCASVYKSAVLRSVVSYHPTKANNLNRYQKTQKRPSNEHTSTAWPPTINKPTPQPNTKHMTVWLWVSCCFCRCSLVSFGWLDALVCTGISFTPASVQRTLVMCSERFVCVFRSLLTTSRDVCWRVVFMRRYESLLWKFQALKSLSGSAKGSQCLVVYVELDQEPIKTMHSHNLG